MTGIHDKQLQGCQSEHNSDTVKPDAAGPGSLVTSGGVNCETGWVAAAAWPVLFSARGVGPST